MMYSGDEYYSDEITSPLYRPMPSMRLSDTTIKRKQVKRAKRVLRQYRPDVYAECADLYDDPFNAIPMNGTDYHVFGEV